MIYQKYKFNFAITSFTLTSYTKLVQIVDKFKCTFNKISNFYKLTQLFVANKLLLLHQFIKKQK